MGERSTNAALVLDERSRRVCRVMSRSRISKEYYLAGGTGLAVQLGHRRSFDLDFFQFGPEERIDVELIASSLNRLFSDRELSLEMSQIDQCTWTISGTKVSFIAYPFPLLDSPVAGDAIGPDLEGLQVATVRDIACMKAYALGRRMAFRDYLDLYFVLVETGMPLEDLTAACERKFTLAGEHVFSTRLFLEQLSYSEDVEDRESALSLLVNPGGLTANDVAGRLRSTVSNLVREETDNPGGGLQ